MTDTRLPGINVPALSRFLEDSVPGAEPPFRFELIGDGRSNLTFRVSSAGHQWVLRRPPLGHILPTAHDMAREYRAISALADTGVPVPRTFALCEDPSVNDYPFYVMEFVDGVIIGEEMPAGYAAKPEERRQLGLGMVEALAKLHAVDYREVGLEDFGRPDAYLERQVARWATQWDRSKTRDLPEIEELGRRLAKAIPVRSDSTIVHGDFRLGNIVMARDRPGAVLALLDWEMATLGDPLADLGYTLVFWGQAGDPPERFEARVYAQITTAGGFLNRAELVQHYADVSGRDVSAIDFYEAFALYKLAVIVEGIWARHIKGQTVGEGFEQYEHSSPILVRSALDYCDASELRSLRG
jgi:aminoglycoside phosphotransferase (APT) family kinase protein